MIFQGKSVLVTGAASGIGLAATRAFAELGAMVTMADLNGDAVAARADELVSEGYNVAAVTADISDPDACTAMVAMAVSLFGRLDVAVNNAGMPTPIGGLFEAFPLADWRKVMSVNLDGLYYAMRAEVPALKNAGGGAIVNTASAMSLIAAKGMAAYVTSKHGVAGLTRAAALDLIEYGIRVNAICPGFVDTGMTAAIKEDAEMFSALAASAPIGRIAQPAEMANAIVWLASDASSFSVGQLMAMDGGVMLL